jgi:hypothetical protein
MNNKENSLICNQCKINFNSRTTLWRHRKKCNFVKEQSEQVQQLQEENIQLKMTNLENEKKHLENENQLLMKLVDEKEKNSVTNITNNNNNTFNLNVFLNETCKDAMNIDDFIDSIEVTIEDLQYLGKNGYVEGMSKLILQNLQQLEVSRRPLHCSDVKREMIYIRDKDAWEKETKLINKLAKVLTNLSRLHTIAVQSKYQEKYPQCVTDRNSKEHREYGEIVHEAFGGSAKNIDNQNNKIIRKFLHEIEIKKNEYKKQLTK